jgi:periplasmic divalent cation tolerance protein
VGYKRSVQPSDRGFRFGRLTTTVYVTAPPSAAPEIATALIEAELAACVNQFDCRSTYRWDGETVREEEVALLIKTTADRYDDLKSRVESIHPHDVPCIERFDETDRCDSFGEWIGESVR